MGKRRGRPPKKEAPAATVETEETIDPADEMLEPEQVDAANEMIELGEIVSPEASPTPETPPVELPKPVVEFPELPEITGGAYLPKHVESRLDAVQGEILKRIFEGLDAAGERLRNNKRIQSNADAIRWILERVNDAI